MPSRKPYSQWDYWWVVEETVMRKRRLRHPPRLGARRSLIARWRIWWADRRWPVWLLAGVLFFAFVVLTVLLIGRPTVTAIPLAGLGVIAMAAATLPWLQSGRIDARCVAAAHARTRCVRGAESLSLARAIAERQRAWKSWMADMPRKLRNAILLGSLSARLLFTGYMLVLFAGPWIGLIAEMRSSAPIAASAARPVIRQRSGFFVYQQGTLVTCMVVYATWHQLAAKRLRSRMSGAVTGNNCPDCGYEVERGLVITPEPGVEIAIGPKRCSECGCPWPLVPPDLNAESVV